MTQPQFIRWLLRQNLTDYQAKMAAILYAMNGYESAARFVAEMQALNGERIASESHSGTL